MSGTEAHRPDAEGEAEGPRITDRRKIDPTTYQVRESAEQPAAPAAGPLGGQPGEDVGGRTEALQADPVDPVLADIKAQAAAAAEQAAEAVADTQRIAAEYANYRKRVDRDRELNRDIAVGSVLAELLPILDDVQRARAHGDLAGPFKVVAESLEAVVTRLGLEAFGAPDEPFDPAVHEAMTASTEEGYEVPTVTAVYQVGYRLRGRVLRPARVAVTESESA